MADLFFDKPILNSPYQQPGRHWELDEQGQPTRRVVEIRRPAAFITPIPKSRRQRSRPTQQRFVFDEGEGPTEQQTYAPNSLINELRLEVDKWRKLPNPRDWRGPEDRPIDARITRTLH